ncbi:MAG: carboxy terminal-processing peptidase [bacterium]
MPQQEDLSPQLRRAPIIVAKLLEQYHFARQPLNAEKAKEWIDSYMRALDYNHFFFFESDLEDFQNRFAADLAERTKQGDLSAAYAIFDVFLKRVEERTQWTLQRLEKPLDFSKDEDYELDRSKAPWPKDQAEADALWEKRVKFDVLQERMAVDKEKKDKKEKKEPPLKVVAKRYQRLQRAAHDYDSEDILQTYLNALSSLYDPHSQYMSPATLEDFSIGMKLALVGIGAVLTSEDGYCTIKEIIPGGPADLDKRLGMNDRIIAVAQDNEPWVDVVDMKLRNVVQLIRGEKNTVVRLKVIPANVTDPSQSKEIKLVRDKIELTAQQANAQIVERKDVNGKAWRIGVIEVPSFYGDVGGEDASSAGNGAPPHSTTDDVVLLLERLQKEGINGLALDLRRNGGGLLDEAVNLSGLFIEKGPVVQVKDQNGNVRVYAPKKSNLIYTGPMIVLTSRQSASASEIFAGCMQNYERALIVGDKNTHGKGTVQAVVELDKLMNEGGGDSAQAGALKLTIQKFYLPNGHSTQNRGVVPDISLPSPNDYLKIGEADAPHALPWDEIRPAKFKKASFSFLNQIKKLREHSQKRISESKPYQLLQEEIEKLRVRLEEGKISLNETKRIQERDADEIRRKRAKEFEKQLTEEEKKIVRFVVKGDRNNAHVELDAEKKLSKNAAKAEDKENDEENASPSYAKDLGLRETLDIMADMLSLSQTSSSLPTLTAHTP